MITGRMLLAARILSGQPREVIATLAGCTVRTLQKFENTYAPPAGRASVLSEIIGALAKCGVKVTDGGIEIRERRAPESLPDNLSA